MCSLSPLASDPALLCATRSMRHFLVFPRRVTARSSHVSHLYAVSIPADRVSIR